MTRAAVEDADIGAGAQNEQDGTVERRVFPVMRSGRHGVATDEGLINLQAYLSTVLSSTNPA